MKTLKFFVVALLVISLESVISVGVTAQTPACVDCGVTGFNPVHKRGCPHYVAPVNSATKSASGSTSGSSPKTYAQPTELILLQGVVNALFNASEANSQKELEEQRIAAELKAQQEAEEKRIKEEEERAEHEKLMNTYKPLGNSEVKYKSINESGKFAPIHFTCKIISCKGSVLLKKANGDMVTLWKGANFDLAVGDVITTGTDGMIKLHFAFEKGGEDLLIGRNTNVKIIQTPEGIQCPKLFDGKLRAYSPTVMESMEQAYDEVRAEFIKKYGKKFQVRTPTVAVAVRGTDFTVTESPQDGTEVIVMEGSVELKGIGNEATILIEAGFKGHVTPEGTISGPYKIDLTNIDKWWEDDSKF